MGTETLFFRGVLTAREEFLYPDTPMAELPCHLELAVPRNGRRGIQLLLETDVREVSLSLSGEGFEPEWFRMIAVPVEYNTGDGVEQGGAMVLEKRPEKKPDYATRLAPFWVYDCLKPIPDGKLQAVDGKIACYFCLVPNENVRAGEHRLTLNVRCGAGVYTCDILVRVYDVMIPQDSFPVTNWFSRSAIQRLHHVENGTAEYYEMVRKYARAMRRIHQTMFYMELDDDCVVCRAPYRFDFHYLRPLIACFFEEGMQTLEIGPLLSRGDDARTGDFKCAFAPDVPVDTLDGYALLTEYVKSLVAFLQENGWAERVVFHVHDEPDINYADDALLQARRRQYLLAVSILRKYLPGVRIIEAVATNAFYGGVDLWVPGTAGYEAHKAEFDRLTALGETVWTYVCCSPEGHWLNRFLDFAVLKGRLIFWGCAANRIRGFLHWGFNQFPYEMNPFEGTSCPNPTGLGTNFPCGDSFIVYPGTDGPWPGMRMEAARRGAEDAALLQALRARDESAHDRLVAKVFTNNREYNDDPAYFEQVYEELLKALS